MFSFFSRKNIEKKMPDMRGYLILCIPVHEAFRMIKIPNSNLGEEFSSRISMELSSAFACNDGGSDV